MSETVEVPVEPTARMIENAGQLLSPMYSLTECYAMFREVWAEALRCRPGGSTVEAPELTTDCARLLPCGAIDDADFESIEMALDAAGAPCRAPDGRWLKLNERIDALSARGVPCRG